jgi:hypothetical protein
MTVRAICLDAARDFWIDVARELKEGYGWEFVYWVGGPVQEAPLKALFPGLVYHLGLDARLGRPAPALAGLPPAPYDTDLFRAMAPHQVVAEKMLERYDLCGYFRFPDKVATYHRMAMYWKAVLDHLKPDVILFPVSPHAVFDYVVYGLCQVLGIATVMFERTTVPPYVFAQERFEDGAPALAEAYRRALAGRSGPVELPAGLEAYWRKQRADYGTGMAPHMQAVLKDPKHAGDFAHLRKREPTAARLRRAAAGLGRRLAGLGQVMLTGPEESYYVKKGKPLGVLGMGRLEYLSYRLDVRRAKRRLRATYDRLAARPTLDVPYVYVALQAEPERQTTPNGGAFLYQYLMVDMLSKAVPEGWRVFVKEHVVQLNPHFTAERGRTPGFYEFIAGLPNVALLADDMVSFDLIDRARAVATVSGSTGWEAVLRGKPALLFGHAWYRDCEGVFRVPTAAALREALAAVAAGYTVDPEKVRLYLRTVAEICAEGFVDGKYEAISGIPHTLNGKALARAAGELFLRRRRPAAALSA